MKTLIQIGGCFLKNVNKYFDINGCFNEKSQAKGFAMTFFHFRQNNK